MRKKTGTGFLFMKLFDSGYFGKNSWIQPSDNVSLTVNPFLVSIKLVLLSKKLFNNALKSATSELEV